MRHLLRIAFCLVAATLLPACGDEGDTIIIQGAPDPGPFLGGVFFVADWVGDQSGEVYVGEAAGTRVYPAGPPAGSTVSTLDLRFSPDRQWISYKTDLFLDDVWSVMVAPVTGGVAAGAPAMGIAGRPVLDWQWSPNSDAILFRSNYELFGKIDLFVVSVEGAAQPVNISNTVIGEDCTAGYAWAPDGSRIAYIADKDADGVNELYSVLPDGTGEVKLNGALTAAAEVYSLAWSPDSQRVAYAAIQSPATLPELYTAPADTAGASVRVSGAMAAGGFGVSEYAWAPDGSRIAYYAHQDSATSNELYTSAPDTETGNVKISGALASNRSVVYMKWAPDSSRIAYLADQDTNDLYEYYSSTPISAASNVKLNGVIVGGGFVGANLAWAPDSSRVAYFGAQQTATDIELFTSLGGGGGNVKVSAALPANGDVQAFSWSPDSTRLLYRADGDVDELVEIYVTQPASAASVVKVSGPSLGGNDIGQGKYDWTYDSSRIVYISDLDSPDVFELFSVTPAGTGLLRISGATLALGGGVSVFASR